MHDPVPLRPTVVAPNYFGTVPSNNVAAMCPTAAASIGHKVVASNHVGELLVGGCESRH